MSVLSQTPNLPAEKHATPPAPKQPEANWGTVNVAAGSRSPWGEVQVVARLAPGITQVSTASHGGVKLSPERNRVIPAPLRNSSGWYEEDCEENIVVLYFPAEYARGRDADKTRADAQTSVKNWFPDQFEAATGQSVSLEESTVLRDRAAKADADAFRAAHADDFVQQRYGQTRSTYGDANPNAWIPAGYALIQTKRETTGEVRYYLMAKSEVIIDGRQGQTIAVADPTRHLDVTDIVDLAPAAPNPSARDDGPKIHDLGRDVSGLTPAAARRANKELDKVYRFRDGDDTTTESLIDHLARVGLVGKHRYYGDRGMTYSVQYGGHYVHPVSKAAYDALTGVPDTTTEQEAADADWSRARDALDRAKSKYWSLPFGQQMNPAERAKVDAAEAEVQGAKARYDEVGARERAARTAWEAERLAMRTAALERAAAAAGVEFDY